jgi:hypothetical protein
LKISNYRKILQEKIEFEYYIFNVFLIAAKCILLNNSAEFSTFFVQSWSDSRTSLMLSWKVKITPFWGNMYHPDGGYILSLAHTMRF